LEDFVARIDVPQLDDLSLFFFDRSTHDTSQLVQFIYRKASFKTLDEVHVWFLDDSVRFTFSSQAPGSGRLSVEIWGVTDWDLWTMVPFCTSFSRPLSSVESLYIHKRRDSYFLENNYQEWLDILRQFTALKDIYLCETSGDHIAFVLLEPVEGRLTEASRLPTMQNVFLDAPPSEPLHDAIVQFVVARELAGPVIM
jgi:hypothetical protein